MAAAKEVAGEGVAGMEVGALGRVAWEERMVAAAVQLARHQAPVAVPEEVAVEAKMAAPMVEAATAEGVLAGVAMGEEGKE